MKVVQSNSMMQWIERNWNKAFVNLPSLPWKSEISEAVHLAQPGLRQTDEIQVNFEILKFTVQRNLRLFALFTHH